MGTSGHPQHDAQAPTTVGCTRLVRKLQKMERHLSISDTHLPVSYKYLPALNSVVLLHPVPPISPACDRSCNAARLCLTDG